MKTVAEIELEARRHGGLLHIGRLNRRLRQLTVLVAIHHRIVALVPADNLGRLPLYIRDILHTDIGTASRFLQLDVLRLRLLTESLLYLPLHLTLKVLNVLSYLSARRHKVMLLRQLRHVVVLQLIRRRANHIVLLLAENRAGRMLRYVRDQTIQLGEGLIARVAVVMILAFQLAERSTAALFRSIKSVRRGGAHRRYDRRFYNVQHLFVKSNQILANAR